ncbi:MAG: energy transducer TonB, partial [Cyclobacteriaceae bacterium]
MKSLRTTLLAALVLTFGMDAFSQQPIAYNSKKGPAAETATTTRPLTANPQFIGGNEALAAFMHNELKYPESSFRKGQEGTVILSYYINTEGSIDNITV